MVMVESMVPMPAMPSVPTNNGTTMRPSVGAGAAVVMKKKKNSGTATTSTANMNRKLEVAFARNTIDRSRGTSNTPSRHPCSFSWANERPSPKSEVNTMSAHSSPPLMRTISRSRTVSARAAPYTMMTRSA